jgi:hypothetical protein
MAGEPQQGTNPVFGNDCSIVQVLDPAGIPSPLVIRTGDTMQLQTTWTMNGTFAPGIAGVGPSAGVLFTVTYFFEGFGSAPEGTVGQVGPKSTDTLSPSFGGGVFTFGPADLRLTTTPNAAGMTDGTYELVVVVDVQGFAITAFNRGPIIRVVP